MFRVNQSFGLYPSASVQIKGQAKVFYIQAILTISDLYDNGRTKARWCLTVIIDRKRLENIWFEVNSSSLPVSEATLKLKNQVTNELDTNSNNLVFTGIDRWH